MNNKIPPTAIIAIICIAIVIGAILRLFGVGVGDVVAEPIEYMPATITRVVDGDTVKAEINGVTETVRLIGIDTPETKHPRIGKEPYGEEASDYTTALLEGEAVVLEYDLEPRDHYGRLLAYIYIEDAQGEWDIDGRYYAQANEEIARAGLASPMTIAPNNRYAERYAEAVRVARERRIGMWAQ